jgi:hypothetical protein
LSQRRLKTLPIAPYFPVVRLIRRFGTFGEHKVRLMFQIGGLGVLPENTAQWAMFLNAVASNWHIGICNMFVFINTCITSAFIVLV